jgi:catechol 2,3-dioxygenase-like lactoylglutathione lyase family enzyme
MVLKLKAVVLSEKHMATMVAFYRDVVGFPLEWDGVDPSVIIEQDGLRFLLFGRSDFEELSSQKYTYPSGNNGTFELALDVDAPNEVDEEYNRMESMGAAPIIAPKTYPWGLHSCYVADPEGNLIETATWKSPNT